MTALYIGAREPLVDLQTGLCMPIWYRFFERLFRTAGAGAVSNEEGFQVFPQAQDGALLMAIAALGSEFAPQPQQFLSVADDVSPAAQQYFMAVDDVMPLIGSLRDQIAMLQSRIDDMQQGGATL